MLSRLPVDDRLDEIVSIVREERRAVVLAPPGAGKTTRIPPALTQLGRTILLQPRRVAARTLARRIAWERGWTLGDEIGWQIRFERRFHEGTRLLVATEGILTARLQDDPLLGDFDVVVLDEFHERSIHADLALALVRQAASARDDLRIVVMSATIDPGPVSRFLGARAITIEGRQHPIEIRYAPNLPIVEAIRETVRTAAGHVLCFLPGAREIERTRADLGMPHVFPLHGSLDVDAQERAIAPSDERKIILATNVAETSLTVEGVTDVVDGGLQKIVRFDPETAVDHLVTERISRDSADQRAGRAGRIGPGRATRLWDERMILRPHREPEVQRVDLASAVLDVIAWGGDPCAFEWFERPPAHRIDGAVELLRRLGAIDPDSRLTPLGGKLRRFPLHPRLARLLVEAGGAEMAVRVAALLSEDVRNAGEGDALAIADELPRDHRTLRELRAIARNVLGNDYEPDAQPHAGEDRVRRAILAGYPDRVAVRREPGSPRLLLSSGTGAVLSRESALHSGEFLVALQVAGGAESLVRIASVIERDWLVPTHREKVHFLSGNRVKATERVWYDAILLSELPATPDEGEVRRLTAERLRQRIDPEIERRLAFARMDVDWSAIIAATGGIALPGDLRARLDKLAPTRLSLPSGRTAKLDYRDDGSVVAAVKLQELFGLADSPLIGPDRTPVTFSLLAPNGRSVQITRDLRSFWNGGYREVRKELRGRYPRHPWPEDPWTARATHRTKKR